MVSEAKEFFTAYDIADYLNCGANRARLIIRLMDCKGYPVAKIGHARVVSRNDFIHYLDIVVRKGQL